MNSIKFFLLLLLVFFIIIGVLAIFNHAIVYTNDIYTISCQEALYEDIQFIGFGKNIKQEIVIIENGQTKIFPCRSPRFYQDDHVITTNETDFIFVKERQ